MNGDATVLPENSTFVGRLKAKDVTLRGRFEGILDSQGRVEIGRTAKVKASLRAQRVEVDGEFEGEIRAASLIFNPGARARGAFAADRLVVLDGATVNGAFPHSHSDALEAPWPESRPPEPLDVEAEAARPAEAEAARPAEAEGTRAVDPPADPPIEAEAERPVEDAEAPMQVAADRPAVASASEK